MKKCHAVTASMKKVCMLMRNMPVSSTSSSEPTPKTATTPNDTREHNTQNNVCLPLQAFLLKEESRTKVVHELAVCVL